MRKIEINYKMTKIKYNKQAKKIYELFSELCAVIYNFRIATVTTVPLLLTLMITFEL